MTARAKGRCSVLVKRSLTREGVDLKVGKYVFIHCICVSFSDAQKSGMSGVTSRDERLTYLFQLCPDGPV